MTNYQKYLDVGLKAVEIAGEVIKDAYINGFGDVETKSDNSPVTIIDKNCETLIQKVILASFPEHAFLGEETGKSKNDSEFTWIIDPIDGTKNFIRGIPLSATLITLMHRDQFVVGISNIPLMNECFYASSGGGAFKNGQPISVSKTTNLPQAYVSHGGIKYFTKENITQNLVNLTSQTWASKGFGDAWAYHLVAQGSLDINLEAMVKVWDVAAHTVIITEAGGQVSDLQGKPIDINTQTFLATNGLLHQQVLEYFK